MLGVAAAAHGFAVLGFIAANHDQEPTVVGVETVEEPASRSRLVICTVCVNEFTVDADSAGVTQSSVPQPRNALIVTLQVNEQPPCDRRHCHLQKMF